MIKYLLNGTRIWRVVRRKYPNEGMLPNDFWVPIECSSNWYRVDSDLSTYTNRNWRWEEEDEHSIIFNVQTDAHTQNTEYKFIRFKTTPRTGELGFLIMMAMIHQEPI
jgi:hypothetical protein